MILSMRYINTYYTKAHDAYHLVYDATINFNTNGISIHDYF